MPRALQWIASILLACLLSTCTDYRIVRPSSQAGKQCAIACDQARAMCDRNAEAEVAGTASGCEAGNERAEEICSRHEGEFHERCMAAKSTPLCVEPAPNYAACTSDWELCVLSCGGRMVEL